MVNEFYHFTHNSENKNGNHYHLVSTYPFNQNLWVTTCCKWQYIKNGQYLYTVYDISYLHIYDSTILWNLKQDVKSYDIFAEHKTHNTNDLAQSKKIYTKIYVTIVFQLFLHQG